MINAVRIMVGGFNENNINTYISNIVSQMIFDSFIQISDITVIKGRILTNYGFIDLILWNNTNSQAIDKFDEKYYTSSDGAVIFCDLSSKEISDKIVKEIKYIQKMKPDIPIILCGEKIDIEKLDINLPCYKIITFKKKYIFESLQDMLEKINGENINIILSPIPQRLYPIKLMLNNIDR